MTLQISAQLQKFIDEQISSGRYESPEEVLEASLAALEQQIHSDLDFGDLDALLAEGEADVVAGHLYDGEAVFAEIRQMSEARRKQ